MSTLLDNETVVLDDLDFEERCDVSHLPEHAADVVTRFRCCGASGLLCTGHMEAQRQGVNARLALGIRIVCGYCGEDVKSWDELVEVITL